MQLQPASGARDLNPQQVETNHLIASRLSNIYRLWGYEQISPPNIERLETLMADGGISSDEILKVIADEPVGLRPELTTSIVRAACTRFAEKKRPLRYWSLGTAFKCRESIDGGNDIEENLQCGVELIGIKDIKAEIEILSILLDSLESINLSKKYKTTLLIGHTSLMKLITSTMQKDDIDKIKNIIVDFNLIELNKLDIGRQQKELLEKVLFTRGTPREVLGLLVKYYGRSTTIDKLENLFKFICPIASKHDIKIQLDPTFESHYELYSGLVFQLVCESDVAPVVVAKGGRYDDLVSKFSKSRSQPYGAGFSYSIDKIRELNISTDKGLQIRKKVLIAFKNSKDLEKLINRQQYWHSQKIMAVIASENSKNIEEATSLLNIYNCNEVDWIE